MSRQRKFASIQTFSDADGTNVLAIADDGSAWVGAFSQVEGNVVAWNPVLQLPDAPPPATMKISADALKRAGAALG